MMKAKICFIDDEVEILETYQSLFTEYQNSGFFSSPKGFLQACQIGLEPDLVISDLRMPEMTGLELLKNIRQLGMPCPFVLVSGFAKPEDIDLANALGAFAYLPKPLNIDVLKNTLHSALSGISQRDLP